MSKNVPEILRIEGLFSKDKICLSPDTSISIDDRFDSIPKLTLTEPAKIEEKSDRVFNVASKTYSKTPIIFKQTLDESSSSENDFVPFVGNSPIFFQLSHGGFASRNIRSPRLVRAENFAENYENLSPREDISNLQGPSFSPSSAQCCDVIKQKLGCVIS